MLTVSAGAVLELSEADGVGVPDPAGAEADSDGDGESSDGDGDGVSSDAQALDGVVRFGVMSLSTMLPALTWTR